MLNTILAWASYVSGVCVRFFGTEATCYKFCKIRKQHDDYKRTCVFGV